jgi:hypothetical protein
VNSYYVKTIEANLLLISEKIGRQCLTLSPPTLTSGWDESNDGEVLVNAYCYYTTQLVQMSMPGVLLLQAQMILTVYTVAPQWSLASGVTSICKSRQSRGLTLRRDLIELGQAALHVVRHHSIAQRINTSIPRGTSSYATNCGSSGRRSRSQSVRTWVRAFSSSGGVSCLAKRSALRPEGHQG